MANSPTAEENIPVPLWLNDLEGRLKAVMQSHQLGHEVGAGSACLNCSGCPGLDLHYWRKQCIICKCKKEDHDIPPDDSVLRFEILLTNSDSKRYNTFGGDLQMKVRQNAKNAAAKQFVLLDKTAPLSTVTFDWLPPDTPSELTAAYMSALPSNKLPITGTHGAKYRQMQLGKQIPLYDISPDIRYKMSSKEKQGFQTYLEDLRSNVGMGKIQMICQKSFLEESVPHQSLQTPDMAKNLKKQDEEKADSFDRSSCKGIEIGMEDMELNNINKMNSKPSQLLREFSPNLKQTPHIDFSNASYPKTPATTLRLPSAFVPVHQRTKSPLNSESLCLGDGSNKLSSNQFSKCQPDSRKVTQNSNFHQSKIPDVSKHENGKHIGTELQQTDSHTHKNMPNYELNFQAGFDSHPQNYTADEEQDLSNSLKINSGVDQENANSNNVIAVENTLDCWYCKQPLSFGSVAVVADRAGTEKVWHPQCFVCCVCKELLVDLVYFYHQDKVYCGRHYAEKKNISRCYACDELIFVNEFTYAEGKAYHVNHFCCTECDLPLAGKKYILLNDAQPNCLDCYDTKFSNTCQYCKLPIRAEQQGVKLNNLNWHAYPACFKCAGCNKSLVNSKFVLADCKPYCSKLCIPA